MSAPMERCQDRISELPDPVLSHILSLLPAKAATRTCILSRRWKDLWQHFWIWASVLDFTAEFSSGQTPEEFVATVNRYLELHRGKKIQRFLVSFEPAGRCHGDVQKWVEFAAARGVEELRLDLSEQGVLYYSSDLYNWRSAVSLAYHLFDCGSLRVLSLGHCSFSSTPDFGRLRLLNSLSLRRVNVSDDVLRSILAECRLLERLLLMDCVQFNSIKLASPGIRLKQLALVDCWELSDLEISAPSLQSFHFSGEFNFLHSFGAAAALVDAFICSIGRTRWEPYQNYVKLLSDIAGVEILTVCTATLMYVTTWSEYMPEDVPVPLPNLRELQLLMDHMTPEYLSYIYGFFRLCPSPLLERLFVRLPEISQSSGVIETAIEQPAGVQFNQLKVIKMYNFKGSRDEMKLVRFLLEKAAILEFLILVAPQKSSAGVEPGKSPGFKFVEEMDARILQGQLLALPRASSGLRVLLCEYLQDDTKINPHHTALYYNHTYVAY